MSSESTLKSPWEGDLLGYAAFGETFTNLVKSITGTKVISIEAGFGHGKTFFRKAWAEHLRQAGEFVIEIDAQQSDHSGEPIITFLGALLAAQPPNAKPLLERVGTTSLKVAGAASRVITKAILRSGADEVIETVSDHLSARAEGNDVLKGAIEELEQGMSRLAGQMVASQLAAEQARMIELPDQIDTLRKALVEGRETGRLVILIDELDRCHPEYAIALLEAMKLVFGREGFVFCLMVNADYLERIAHHRFGTSGSGESYLEKFVDLRLQLMPGANALATATEELAKTLPLNIPFGDGPEFTIDAAAKLAGQIAGTAHLSFRQIKRVLDRVELALRCYGARPLDPSLLVFLAFSAVARRADNTLLFEKKLFPRGALTAEAAQRALDDKRPDGSIKSDQEYRYRCEKFIAETCPELRRLPEDRYGLPPPTGGGEYLDFYKVLAGLGPRYVPEHREILNNVHRLMQQ